MLCYNFFLLLFQQVCTRGVLNKDVASSGTDLLFYERHTKGKAGLDDAARTLYTASHPQMAALMSRYTAIKSAYCASQQVALPLCYFALPGESPASWTSNTQTEWLSMAYTAVGCSPPPGFAWTSHSLRSGAALRVGLTLTSVSTVAGWLARPPCRRPTSRCLYAPVLVLYFSSAGSRPAFILGSPYLCDGLPASGWQTLYGPSPENGLWA